MKLAVNLKDQYENKTYRVVREFEGGLKAYGQEGPVCESRAG